MQQRDTSIDALRGFAILTMILSGSIAYGDILPAWMFHAQVPPPLHKFDATIAGITWVDLVFPFFLFSMGAAIPLALQKHIENNSGFLSILKIALKRFLLLTFFALFTNHLKAWAIAETPTTQEHLLSILAFILLFFQFYNNQNKKHQQVFLILKIVSFLIAILLLWKLPFWGGKGFDFYKSDIIIMLLGNMAFFATIIYYFTHNKPNLRLGILTFIMAIFLAAKESQNSWAKEIFSFNHIGNFKFDWVYKFYFLKYLFIVLPGTIAGDYILSEMKKKNEEPSQKNLLYPENLLAIFSLLLICFNLYGLFTRALLLNLVVTTVLCGASLYIVNKQNNDALQKKMISFGSFLLLLGLCFEAYEGGIRKDWSTYSYYFVTSGLAFFSLIFFSVITKRKYLNKITKYFALNGKNPMVAYVAGNLLLLPILSLTQTKQYWDAMNQNEFMGFMKGVLFTAIVSLINLFFVKRKWFWKT